MAPLAACPPKPKAKVGLSGRTLAGQIVVSDMAKVRRRLGRALVAHQPYERWNAFIDLVATEDANSLTATQRTAQLAYWYDSEVQNGGHL